MKYNLSLAIILLFKIVLLKAETCVLIEYEEKILECNNLTNFNEIQNTIQKEKFLNELRIFHSTIELPKNAFQFVEKLKIENSFIPKIDLNSFENAKLLKKISFNNINFNSLDNLNFQPLGDNLDELIFTKNKINNEIVKLLNQLEALRGLKYLDLSSNEITTNLISRFNFPQNLEILSLNNNLINSNGFRFFNNLDLLNELYLDNNQINRIENEYFNSFRNLQILSLAKNYIQRIPSKAFFNLKNLRVIQLQKQWNGINFMDNYAFSIGDHHYGFDSIDLSDNKISHLPVDCIFCSHNPTQKISIRKLNIENNYKLNASVILKLDDTLFNGTKTCLNINGIFCNCNLNVLNEAFHITGNCLSVSTSSNMQLSLYLSKYCENTTRLQNTTEKYVDILTTTILTTTTTTSTTTSTSTTIISSTSKLEEITTTKIFRTVSPVTEEQ